MNDMIMMQEDTCIYSSGRYVHVDTLGQDERNSIPGILRCHEYKLISPRTISSVSFIRCSRNASILIHMVASYTFYRLSVQACIHFRLSTLSQGLLFIHTSPAVPSFPSLPNLFPLRQAPPCTRL